MATQSGDDIERILRPDRRVISGLPQTPYRDAVLLRLRARCAFIKGDSATATALLRDSAQLLDKACYLDEPERDRFAIGCLIGGEEGAALCAAAEAA